MNATFDVSEYIGLVERQDDLITLTRKCGSVFEQMQIKISELRERAIFEKCSTEELKRIRKTINGILKERSANR